MTVRLVLIIAILALSACATTPKSQVRIEGTTEESTTTSLQSMYASLGNRDKCLLQSAILRIQVGDKEQQEVLTKDKSAQATPLGPKINGLSYEEIIALSQKYPDKVLSLCRN